MSQAYDAALSDNTESLGKLRKIQLEILDEVLEFCKKYNVKFWIDYGALLGAIRHSGFIPWDDDVDIGMMRSDYEFFVKNFNSYSERFKVYDMERYSKYRESPIFLEEYVVPIFSKIFDTKSKVISEDRNLYVNIDLFPYDYVPEETDDYNKQVSAFKKYYKLFALQAHKQNPSGNRLRQIIVSILRKLFYFFPRDLFSKKCYLIATQYNNSPTRFIANLASGNPSRCDSEMFFEIEFVNFEDRKLPIPHRYDEWLSLRYGNYMQFPPVDQRIPHLKGKYIVKTKE